MSVDVNSPEVKAAIEEAVKEATTALADNNRKLTNELKNARAKVRDGAVDPEEHQKALDQIEELRSAGEKLQKKYDADVGKLNKSLSDKETAFNNNLIDGALTESLAKAGVKPELMNAAKAMLKGKVVVKADDKGSHTALMGDKAVSDAVKEWAGGDEGKHFVAAQSNSGGAAGGSKQNGSGPPAKRSQMNLEQKAEFIKTQGRDAYLALPQ